MAYLPIPQPCKNNCGAMIYFDKTSAVGHPESDKWYPLAYDKETGIYTSERHNCPNRPTKYSGSKISSNGNGSSHKINPLEKPSEESVQRGITAFSMMTDLIKEVEQIHNLLASMDGKLDRLLNLAERK